MSMPHERKMTIAIWVGCGVSFLAILFFWVLSLRIQFSIIEEQQKIESRDDALLNSYQNIKSTISP
jgi:hypothetical protein